jgi:hypothetical protein
MSWSAHLPRGQTCLFCSCAPNRRGVNVCCCCARPACVTPARAPMLDAGCCLSRVCQLLGLARDGAVFSASKLGLRRGGGGSGGGGGRGGYARVGRNAAASSSASRLASDGDAETSSRRETGRDGKRKHHKKQSFASKHKDKKVAKDKRVGSNHKGSKRDGTETADGGDDNPAAAAAVPTSPKQQPRSQGYRGDEFMVCRRLQLLSG